MKLAIEIVELLRARNQTLAVAESVTGGGLASAITEAEGASHCFRGGVVAYSETSKVRDLDVSAELIAEKGVYSEEVAEAMAIGAARRFGADWAIATTGVAGPGPSKGVKSGSIWVAFHGPDRRENLYLELPGERGSVRSGAVESALAAFARILRG